MKEKVVVIGCYLNSTDCDLSTLLCKTTIWWCSNKLKPLDAGMRLNQNMNHAIS